MLGRVLPGGEQRNISYQTIWGAGDLTSYESQAATYVDQQTATTSNAVWACVTLISDTISTLPVDAYIRRDGIKKPYRPRPAWVTQPDAMINSVAFWQQIMVSLLIDGNAFVRIFRDPNNGEIINLMCLDPLKVLMSRSPLGQKRFSYTGENGMLETDDVLHVTGSLLQPGQIRANSIVDKLKENIGLNIALENFAARFFGQGTTMAGIIETPGTLTADQSKNLSDSLDRMHRGYKRAHRTGVLSGGATFKPTTVQNDQAQMIDSRKFAVEDIARAFRVPLNMIGLSEKGASSYNSIEQNNIAFVTHTLRPWIARLEDAFSRLLPDRAFISFNTDELLRGDYATRINGYASALMNGWMTINEVRGKEDMSPISAGDNNRVPLANIDITAANLSEIEGKVAMAQKLINIGFEPAEVLKSLGLPAIAHTGLPSVQVQNPTTVPNGSYKTGE